MLIQKNLRTFILFCLFISISSVAATAQETNKNALAASNAVLWEPVTIAEMDLYYGPGGKEMPPDLTKITFIEEEKSGHNKKYRIKDGAGRIWVAKLGHEAQPETAAVRLLHAIGYKTEVNYLVPAITIPGKGKFENVRLEARPENIKRLDEWKWRDNPFVGTNELQGLKIMMVFFTNWDLLDLQNKVLSVNNGSSTEHHYIVSDLGATFGKLGNNNLPIIFRLGRKTGDPYVWNEAGFVKEAKDGKIVFDFKGKGRDLMQDITIEQGRWLFGLLSQLTDKQIVDAFRAANYNPDEIEFYRIGFKGRVAELDKVSRIGAQTASGAE